MKKLLFSSLILLSVACQTREKSLNHEGSTHSDSLTVSAIDSLNTPQDSVRAIVHGSPEQEKLDSMKNAKNEKKK